MILPTPKDTKASDYQNLGPVIAMRMVQGGNSNFAPSEAGSTPSVDPPPYSANPGHHEYKSEVLPPPRRVARPIQIPRQPLLREESKRSLATNYLILRSRHEPVKGTYFIDPSLTAFALDKNASTTVDRSQLMRKFKQRHRHHRRGAFKKQFKHLEPNVIFGNKTGPISVDLSIVCPPENLTVQKTLVQAASKSGDIDIRVRHIHIRRRLNLEVSSRRGNIVILIPRSFDGYIQLYNCKGTASFLPALSNRMALVTKTDHETQVFVGDSQPAVQNVEWQGDTIHVEAGKGDIFIGYVGEDSKPAEQPGFWKKLACALKA